MNFKHFVEVAVAAAGEAAAIIREAAADTSKLTIDFKGKNDLVTEVDKQAQDKIVRILRAEFPGHAILAEEDATDVLVAASEHEFRWIVDPLDGTTNFTRGVPPYAVSIGLEYKGEAVVGVVWNVPMNECFAGSRGGGVTLNGSPVCVSQTPQLTDSLLTTGFPYRELDNVEAYLEALRGVMLHSRGIRRPGSASVDMAYVACGRFDGFFETGLMPWDVAAGTLLVRESGGTVTAMSDGKDPVYAHEIVATNGRIHQELLQLVEPMSSVRGRGIASAR